MRQAAQAKVSEIGGAISKTSPLTLETNLTSRPQGRQQREAEPERSFAGSPKAPIPLHQSVEAVSESAAQPYSFEEEDIDEDEFEDEDDEFEEEYELPGGRDQERSNAHLKLDRLKSIRGNQAASSERLKVLDNVVHSQISEEKLQKIIQAAWGSANKKKLKNAQIEELISWAKEDDFVEEAEALLDLIEEGEA